MSRWLAAAFGLGIGLGALLGGLYVLDEWDRQERAALEPAS